MAKEKQDPEKIIEFKTIEGIEVKMIKRNNKYNIIYWLQNLKEKSLNVEYSNH